MVARAADLVALGHTVTSSWITGKHELQSQHGARADEVADASEQARWAREDIDDLEASEAIIAFTQAYGAVGGRNRGGRHVEMGIAIELGLRIFVVGPRENVFYHLPEVQQYDAWQHIVPAARARGWTCGVETTNCAGPAQSVQAWLAVRDGRIMDGPGILPGALGDLGEEAELLCRAWLAANGIKYEEAQDAGD